MILFDSVTMPTTSPKVSVCMVTYNHEKFISQAIESVLMQQTNFEYELVIGEDCSTDGTRAIVADYATRRPDIVRAFLRDKNLGAGANWMQVLAACRGPYIAYLDGDDYWSSAHKLQKQVDFLDADPECTACFHGVAELRGGSVQPTTASFEDLNSIYTLHDLLQNGPAFYTCSMMYRQVLVPEIPAWHRAMSMGDWPLNIHLAQHGTLGFINESMGVYRRHDGGVWTSLGAIRTRQLFIEAYGIVREHLGDEYHHVIRQGVIKQRCWLASAQAAAGQRCRAIGNYSRCLFALTSHPLYPRRRLLGLIIHTVSPRLLAKLQRLRRVNRPSTSTD